MNASNETVLAVMEIAESADIGPISIAQARAMANEMVAYWPQIETPPSAPKPRSHWKRWDDEEDNMLRTLYEAGVPTGEIAAKLNRSKGAVLGAVSRLQLRRPKSG